MLLVVGGHSNNVGKTSVVTSLIQAIPEAQWFAMKISPNGFPFDSPYAVYQESVPNSHTDPGRYLAAGALRSYWLNADGAYDPDYPLLHQMILESHNVVIESNQVSRVQPSDLYLFVMDYSVPELREPARMSMSRADAFVVIECGRQAPAWDGFSPAWFGQKPVFKVCPDKYISSGLMHFVKSRLWPKTLNS
jgi:hypothetical protein